MRKTIALLMVTAMLLSITACSTGSAYSLSKIKLTETERSWSNPEEQYAELLDTYGGQKCHGAMVVATDKDVIYLYCEDENEKDGETLVSQNTVFDIASMSKVFTAVCILQLAEQGKLSLDDTVDKYFPHYVKGRKITIYNLLHMTSGISDYLNNPDPFWKISGEDAANAKISDILQDRTTDEELLKAMYSAPLEFEPGTQVSYSNTNYRLLAFIIEQLTGMKYCDYVRENIFNKCGMTKTSSMALGDMTYVPADYEELAEYGFTDENGYTMCPNNSRGDGGIHSCVADMLSFDRALFGGKFLSEKSMEILLNDDDMGYCCGLRKDNYGYSHDGSAPTCSGNNKIVMSEEFGHVYIIMMAHSGKTGSADTGDGPMIGTNYTKGVFENGVYINKYADIQAAIPEEYEQVPDEIISDTSEIVNDCENEKDKLREAATKWDCSFYRAWTDNIHFKFVNTDLAAPDAPDYSENDYLNDYSVYMGFDNTDKWTLGDRVTVSLGGKDYVRQSYTGFDSFTGGDETNFIYVRKLDDRLMSVIWIIVFDDEASPEDYEGLFSESEVSSSDADDTMSGTSYTKGVFNNGVYVNKYAGLKLNVPDGFSLLSDSNMEMSRNNELSDITDDRDKVREEAITWDIVLIGYEDIIEIDILNTKSGVPDDTDYTENEYLDDYEDYELKMVPGYMKPQVDKDRVTVNLGGKEYVRDLVVLTDGGETGYCYTYARKLDDELMCIVNIAIWSDKTPEEYEALFK